MRLAGTGVPGVFVRGRETEPLPPLAAAITGFVGLSRRGPGDLPQALRSWGDYLTVFGETAPWGYLAASVFAFFANGGEQCCVVRALDQRNRTAENPPGKCRRVDVSRAARNATPILDASAHESFSLEALDPGSWGNEIRFAINRGSREDLPLTELTQDVAATDTVLHVAAAADLPTNATIRLRHRDAPARQWVATVASADVTAKTVTVTNAIGAPVPKGSVIAGFGFQLVVRYRDREEVFDDAAIASDHPRYIARLVNGDRPEAQYLDRMRQGHSILVRVKPASVALPQSPVIGGFSLGGGGDGGDFAFASMQDANGNEALTAFARVAGRSSNGISVRARPFATALALPVSAGGPATLVTVEETDGFRPGDSIIIGDPTAPGSFETRLLQSADPLTRALLLNAALVKQYPLGAPVAVADRFALDITAPDGRRESIRNLSPLATAGPAYFPTVVNAASQWICVDPAVPAAQAPVGTVALDNGHDPGEFAVAFTLGYLPDGSYSGGTRPQYGLALLEGVPAVSLLALPDLAAASDLADTATGPLLATPIVNTGRFVAAQRQLLDHCRKLGERFALLDPPATTTGTTTIESWATLVADPQLTRFGALYYPWLKVTLDSARDPGRFIPPCGVIAGAMARSDRVAGVSRAPANLTLTGVIDVSVPTTPSIQDNLYPLGVNCVRKLGDGVLAAWGARTLSADPQHRYVSVRRVLLAIVKGLTQQLLWTVFEPHDAALWARIASALRDFLSTLLLRGLTAGRTPDEAFYVLCDATTNPTALQEKGEVHAEVGVALTAPAEFILLTVRRTPEAVIILEADL